MFDKIALDVFWVVSSFLEISDFASLRSTCGMAVLFVGDIWNAIAPNLEDPLVLVHLRMCGLHTFAKIIATGKKFAAQARFAGIHPLPVQWDDDSYVHALNAGRMDILEWLYSNGCPWSWKICRMVATGKDLDLLRWVVERDGKTASDIHPVVAMSGNFEVLRILANALPISKWSSRTCAAAACKGHLEILQWLVAGGCPLDWSTRLNAEQNKQYHIVQWLDEMFWR